MKSKNLLIVACTVLVGFFCIAGTASATSHDVEWVFGNSIDGMSDYILNSYLPSDEELGVIGGSDPTLTLRLNQRYQATVVNYVAHPLQIIAKAASYTSDTVLLSMGATVGSFESDVNVAWVDSGSGTITFTLTLDLYNAMNDAGQQPGYVCELHTPFMRGNFIVLGVPIADPIPETIEKSDISIEL